MVTAMGIVIVLEFLIIVALDWELSRLRKVTPEPQVKSESSWFQTLVGHTTPPEPPKDYPMQSIRRTAGPWRLRRREIEAQMNSKQKERDAFRRKA